MIVGILQPSYLPWLGFFDQIWKSDVFVYYDNVQFEKGSWRNRNRIKTPQGPQWLTVPVLKGEGGFQLIKDVRIDTTNSWQKKQIKAITQNYSKSPFFSGYADGLFGIINSNFDFLLDLNLKILEWLCQILNIRTRTVLSSELKIEGDRTMRLIRIIKHFKGDVFYEGAAGKNYIDLNRFEEHGIDVRFQNYVHPVYRQNYGEFISHLSAIDLIFNHGPDSFSIIKGSKK